MTIHRSLLLALAVLAGCIHAAPPLPPGPSGLQHVVVEQPVNRTGNELVVDGPGMFSRLIGERPSTVPDVLADDLRARLEYQGFRVGKGREDAPVLRTEIRRWDPYTADWAAVKVDIAVTLVEPASGRTLWTTTRSDWSVRTMNAGSRGEAFRMASAAAAEALLAGWQPGTP
jgi:hypothetical protein